MELGVFLLLFFCLFVLSAGGGGESCDIGELKLVVITQYDNVLI